MRGLAKLVLVAALATGCAAVGGDQEDVMAVWDLRETRSVEAVGWPEDAGSMFEADTGQGLERILLPGDVVVEGEFRVNPSRDGGIGDQPYEDELRDLVVTFERESVAEVTERAREQAEQLQVGLGDVPAWSAANADGQDVGPGGAQARSDETVLPDGAIAYLSTRAFPDGGAVLRLTVFWPGGSDDAPGR